MLQVKNLSFTHLNCPKPLWESISFNAAPGESIVIKGANGSGKTTLLYSICGIIPTYIQGHLEGEVLINGEEIKDVPLKELSSKINILFQEPDKQIFMPVVEEEIAFGLENHCLPREEMRRRIDYYLELLGIENLRNSKTDTLSFGQKKLVSFASILTLSPQIYLLDEFTAGIEGKIVNIFSKICETLKKEGKTLILIDHNPVILDFADKIIDLDAL